MQKNKIQIIRIFFPAKGFPGKEKDFLNIYLLKLWSLFFNKLYKPSTYFTQFGFGLVLIFFFFFFFSWEGYFAYMGSWTVYNQTSTE